MIRRFIARVKRATWAALARRVCRHYDADLFRRANVNNVRGTLTEVSSFMDRSGFLRDGRYPGGRHAERKVRGLVTWAHSQFVPLNPEGW